MFKMKALAAVIMSAFLVDGVVAAEFAKEIAPTTVELMDKAVSEPIVSTGAQAPNELANAWLAKAGKMRGYHDNVYIAVGTFKQQTSPRTVSDIRALGAMTAQLKAKAEIARFLNSTASASIRHSLPPKSPMKTEFDKAKEALNEELEKLLLEYEEALSAEASEKANQVAGISLEELYVKGLAASLQKYGIDLDIPGLKAESKQRLIELQNKVKSLEERLSDIKKRTEELAGALNNEQTSTTKLLSEMVISGAVVVNSWERLENRQYEVAVVVVWSPAQERFIRSVLGMDKDPVVLKPTTGKSLNEYVTGLPWEKTAGTRWIVDRDGTPHLFGIGIEEIRDQKSSTLERAAAMADSDATSNLVMALHADVKFQQQGDRKGQNKDGKQDVDEDQSVNSIVRDIKADVQGMKLVGVSPIYEGIRPSPVTNRNVYVKVLHYSPLSVRDGHELLNRQLDTAREVGKAQQELKGYINQGLANVEAARNDAESYTDGAAKANARAEERAQAAEQVMGSDVGKSRPTSKSDNARMREGSFGGAGSEDFSF